MSIQPLKLEFKHRQYHVRDVIPVDLSDIAVADSARVTVRVYVSDSQVGGQTMDPPAPIARGPWADYNPVGAEPTPITFTPYRAGHFQVKVTAHTVMGHDASVVTYHTPIVEVLP